MLRTIADEFLLAYVEASDRYSNAVEQMFCQHHLASFTRHTEFLIAAEEVRELRIKTEEARTAMVKHRLEH